MFSFAGVIVDKLTVVGYILKSNGKLYFVTKQYGIELAYNNFISDARVNNHKVVGERLISTINGNRQLLRIGINELKNRGIHLSKSLNVETNSQIHFHKPCIMGCIFDGYGIIIGIRVKNGDTIYNAYKDDIKKFWIDRKIIPNKTFKEIDDYYKYSYMYNFFESKIHGGILAFGLRLISPNFTPILANKLYGADNNIIDTSEPINYFDKDIRDRVRLTARKIEYEGFSSNKAYKVIKNKCEIVAIANFKNILLQNDMTKYGFVLRTPDNGYIVVDRGALTNIEIPNVPSITLYNGDVMYANAYNDAGTLIISGSQCGKRAEARIKNAISRGLNEREFVNTALY